MSGSEKSTFSRRAVLRASSVFGGGLCIALNAPRPLAIAAMESGSPTTFTMPQWETVAAMTGRIIPTDDQPGAIEADCVNFIDKALANEDAAAAPDFLAGLVCLEALCNESEGMPFTALSADRQDDVLASLEANSANPWPSKAPTATDFFETVRVMTIMGFMADPKYGGNAGMVGWRVARYPGPRHHQGGYTPAQMLGEEEIITLWGEKM
jgi:gluconate 2-dehydrogenase gamma chain